jgi:Mor family transcriptional regulator
MPYHKGEECLPPELLLEIQKYVQGALVYIPRPTSDRRGWGLANGARESLDLRNQAIREARARGVGIEELAQDYSLSADAIRKILYHSATEAILRHKKKNPAV